MLVQKDYAKTLRAMPPTATRAFYKGDIARKPSPRTCRPTGAP